MLGVYLNLAFWHFSCPAPFSCFVCHLKNGQLVTSVGRQGNSLKWTLWIRVFFRNWCRPQPITCTHFERVCNSSLRSHLLVTLVGGRRNSLRKFLMMGKLEKEGLHRKLKFLSHQTKQCAMVTRHRRTRKTWGRDVRTRTGDVTVT